MICERLRRHEAEAEQRVVAEVVAWLRRKVSLKCTLAGHSEATAYGERLADMIESGAWRKASR
ncbi:MAG TPA: hypothetical protein VEA38_14515 [Terriglobales bacterium]|nr:hypothetical protein [Terriglobales bacterium]